MESEETGRLILIGIGVLIVVFLYMASNVHDIKKHLTKKEKDKVSNDE